MILVLTEAQGIYSSMGDSGVRGGMVVRELIHLQQGPQDQLPVQPFSFLEGALCGKLL